MCVGGSWGLRWSNGHATTKSHHDVGVEAKAAREKAVVLDQSHCGKFFVFGKDAKKACRLGMAPLPMDIHVLRASRYRLLPSTHLWITVDEAH